LNNKNRSGSDLSDFETVSGELPQSVVEQMTHTSEKIAKELTLSRQRFVFSFLFFSVLGYFASLSLCSQNAIGLTRFSLSVAAILHSLPDPLCPVVCGLAFSFLPLVSLFLFLDRFQLRRLIVRLWWLPVLTTLISCLLMIVLPPTFQHEGMHLMHERQAHLEHQLANQGATGVRDTRTDAGWLMWWASSAVALPAVVVWSLRRRRNFR
jgi:hypothetical protein